MKEDAVKTLNTKINREFVEKLIRDIHEAIDILVKDASKPFEALSRAEKSEVRYYIIVLVEALMALVYHIARKAYRLEPHTPIQTLRLLADRGLISNDELDDFIKLVKLRNLIVHRYWIIDDKRIYENVKEDFRKVVSFIERIRNAFQI